MLILLGCQEYLLPSPRRSMLGKNKGNVGEATGKQRGSNGEAMQAPDYFGESTIGSPRSRRSKALIIKEFQPEDDNHSHLPHMYGKDRLRTCDCCLYETRLNVI